MTKLLLRLLLGITGIILIFLGVYRSIFPYGGDSSFVKTLVFVAPYLAVVAVVVVTVGWFLKWQQKK